MRSGERLTVPPGGHIDVSVLIVVWNQPHLLLRCLKALMAQSDVSFEVVLLDNGSGAASGALFSRLDGFVRLRNNRNLGFLVGCNQAAARASADYLLLLNSDAFVRPGAVANALGALRSAEDVGAVGGRLILPTGRLQEAGSIIWADGTTNGFGRGLDPEDPTVMIRRDVDYCSGAFLMTPRWAWERLGGFDEAYAPAYYEEADYCMRLRQLGLRVVYEPTAAVDHFEFGSEARAGDAVALSERNRAIFVGRHAGALSSFRPRAQAGEARVAPA